MRLIRRQDVRTERFSTMANHDWVEDDRDDRRVRCTKCGRSVPLTPEGTGKATECPETFETRHVKLEIQVEGHTYCAPNCPWLNWRDGYSNSTPRCHLFLERTGDDRDFSPVRLKEDPKHRGYRGKPYRRTECMMMELK